MTAARTTHILATPRVTTHDGSRGSAVRIVLRGARASRGGAAADGACGRRAPLRLRPGIRRDRRSARLVGGRGQTGRVVGDPAAAQEGRTLMTVSHELDARFRAAAADQGLLD